MPTRKIHKEPGTTQTVKTEKTKTPDAVFFAQIKQEITNHDNITDYKVSDDMLSPYINKLDKSSIGSTRLSETQIGQIKSILSNNRILLYFDQYLNIHNRINNIKPNQNNLKIINEKDLSTHFFELPILMDIFKQLVKSSDLSITNITTMYYQAIWERLIPIQRQLKIEYEKIDRMEPRILSMHGLETNDMFIVPDDIIICKATSYNYTAMAPVFWEIVQLKNILLHYKNNNILNSSCCNKNGLVSIYFPKQLCNDTYFQITKSKLTDIFMGLFSINEKNKMVKHKLSNLEIDNKNLKLAKLSKLLLDPEIKNKVLIIYSCRNQEFGTLASYTEFNYRLERLQLLLSRPLCNCSISSEIHRTKFKLPTGFLGLYKWYKKAFKDPPLIWDNTTEYTPFYDTYLSTDITKTFLTPKTHGKSFKLDDIIENPAILKSLPIYKRAVLFDKIYKSYSDDTTASPQIIDALSILLMNLINNSYKFRSFKLNTDAGILGKSKFYYKLLDTLYANNTLNITKCSELLKLILQQLQIFLLQSFRLQSSRLQSFRLQKNQPSTAKSLLSARKTSGRQTLTKNTTKQSMNKRNSKSRKQTTSRLISGSQKTKPNNLIEYTIKLLDLYYKLSNRFGRKIKKTIIQIIDQDEFRGVINQVSQLLINQPNPHSDVILTGPNELHKMTSNLSKLCNGCLDAKPSTAIQ